jgi:hypothetical protein
MRPGRPGAVNQRDETRVVRRNKQTRRVGVAAIALIVCGLSPMERELAAQSFALQQIALDMIDHGGAVAEPDAVNQGDIANLGVVIDFARNDDGPLDRGGS